MGKRCAVEGCPSANPVEIKRRKLRGERPVSSFQVPKRAHCAEEWSTAIGATTPLTTQNYVCQLHFRNEDILTHFEQRMPDGTVFRMERERYMLREGATPIVGRIVTEEEPIASTSHSSEVRNLEIASPAIESADSGNSNNSDAGGNEGNSDVENYESHDDGDTESNNEDDGSDSADDDIAPTYSIQSLKNDLKVCHWRPNWLWSSNTEGIIFVHFTISTMQPRIEASISNDLGITLSLPDKSHDLELDERIREFRDVTDILSALETLEICAGTDHEECKRSPHCVKFLEDDQLYAKNRGFQRCLPCRQLRHQLQNKGNKLKVPEKVKKSVVCKKLNLLKKRHKTLQKKVTSLKSKIMEAQKECSTRKTEIVLAAIASLPDEQQEAIKTCLECSKAKKAQGRRYTKQWVYSCLLLRIKSKRAYKHLRERNILPLPSFTTLARYMKKMGSAYGFQDAIFACMKTKGSEMHPNDRRGTLLVDEMKLSASVALDRKTLRYTGFTFLGDYTPDNQKDEMGDHALIFMYQPFRGTWVQAIACFLSKGCAKSDVLQKLILECIILVEKANFFVDAVVTDGASWNRRVWTSLGVNEGSVSSRHPSDVLEDVDSDDSEATDNASEGGRRLWFLSDFPHLIKTMRNHLVSREETLTPDGTIKLADWDALVEAQNASGSILRVAYLRDNHVRPRNTEKMSVPLAFELFSDRTLAAMKLLKDIGHHSLRDSEPMIQFITRVGKLIKAMMSRTPTDALRGNNEAMQAILDFQEFLEEWELLANEHGVPYISLETLTGFKVSLQATVEIFNFLKHEHDFTYLMTARLNQDALERFNGMVRSACGSNDHPDASQCAAVFRLLSMYSLIKPPRGSNVSGPEILNTLISLKDAPMQDEGREIWLDRLDKIVDNAYVPEDSESNDVAPNIVSCEDYGTYAQAYMAGYVARKMLATTICPNCLECLKSDEQRERDRFTSLMSKGQLIYPSRALFQLLQVIESTFQDVVGLDLHLTVDSLFSVMDILANSESIPLVGCCEHRQTLTKRILNYYVVALGNFVGHSFNRAHNENRRKTQELRKYAKLH